MSNIFNFLAFHSKNSVKIGRESAYCVTVKTSFDSAFWNKSWSLLFAKKQSSSDFKALRPLHTSVEKSDELVDVNGKKKNEDTIIYYGALTGPLKGVRVFAFTSSLGGIALQAAVLQQFWNGDILPLGAALCTCISSFTFLMPFFNHLLTRKYVTEITFNPATDTYIATTFSFFLQKIHLKFKTEDVTIPDTLPLFITMIIKGRPLFVHRDSFLEIEHYIKMMGYNKPMDLKLSENTVVKVKD